jgi:capsid protein
MQRLLLGITSRSRLCDDSGVDFDDVLMEIAEEEMLIEELGLESISLETIASNGATLVAEETSETNEDDSEDTEDDAGEMPSEPPIPPAKSRLAINGSNGKH